ncbi:MAG: TonB-dependent receptor [Crocinitomicaceae bacterium]|nr:TonB-dependent receptor [Crocinitomicaceae bacterium]
MKAVLLALVIGVSGWLHGQTVSGKVTDAATNEPLQGALIFCPGTSAGVYSSGDGSYDLRVPEGADKIVFAYVGYKGDTIPYTGQLSLDIALYPTDNISTVVIEGENKSTEINLLDAQKFQVLSEKELCKAACCNLSESFETNASIDASFTDAITGTRQIKMLGLEGRYTQILFDNIPSVRGLASIYGLSYVPGSWVKEISISKGAGSVISGYESITGQINVAHKSREMKERIFINAYLGSQGRAETNVVLRKPVGKLWSSSLMLHGAMSQKRFDMNDDGFLDNPLFRNVIVRNDWSLIDPGGLRGDYTVSYHHIENVSGQFNYSPSDRMTSQLWGVNTETDRAELVAKTGYVFEKSEGSSLGSQVSVNLHNQSGKYGLRSYQGKQLNARVKLLFASQLGRMVKYTAGLSYVYDDYDEQLDSLVFDRIEKVPGAFAEFSINHRDRLMIITGGRMDHHNSYGWLFTPRLHVRYSIDDRTSIKISGGRGYRSPNLLMDNVGLFASNRKLQIERPDVRLPYGLNMEDAWNYGIVFARKFKLNHRDGSISADIYRTDFVNMIVTDWETAGEISFYNLRGKSYSNNIQLEAQVSPVKRLELRFAYRWLDTKTDYSSQRLMRPLVAANRFFFNAAFSTRESDKGSKWMFDVTAKWLGRQRLPFTGSNPESYRLPGWSNSYWLFNAQVSRHFNSRVEVYVGGENLSGFIQRNPIISPNDPSGQYFDASMIWGPVFGQMGYVGLRWRIE